MGLTIAESQAALDNRFPTSGAVDCIAYSINGLTEFTNLARTPIGATGWAAATAADPSVKANNAVLTSANVVTGGGTLAYFALFTAVTGGTQRTDWQAMPPTALSVGDSVQWAIGQVRLTLT